MLRCMEVGLLVHYLNFILITLHNTEDEHLVKVELLSSTRKSVHEADEKRANRLLKK